MSWAGLTALAVACVYGVVSGFNDGGSLLASFTSGRVISPRLAVALLLVVPLGPVLLGTEVAETIGVSIINLPALGSGAFVGVVGISVYPASSSALSSHFKPAA